MKCPRDAGRQIPPREIVRGTRCPVFKADPDDTSIRVGDGDQEVRSGLTIGRFESEINEVLASERPGTEIGHAAFVDEADLIEEVAYAFRGLVGSKGSSDASDVCRSAESGGKFQSC